MIQNYSSSFTNYERTTNIAIIKLGHPMEQVIDQSEKGDYDLIVIGSHGHSPLKDAVMGDKVRRIY